ncbi:hypothetical protein KGQ34_00035 [Patescibacteria group bacterium]|nr:hypothetical protein [Patescibacteria group bacterium]
MMGTFVSPIFAFYYWKKFGESKSLTPGEKIIFKEQSRDKIEAFSDKKLKGKWLVLPYVVLFILFFGGGAFLFYKKFFEESTNINSENRYIFIGLLVITSLATIPVLQEEDWLEILKIKTEIKSKFLNNYKDNMYYTDSYFGYQIHYLLRIYNYFFNILGTGILGLLAIYLAFSFLSSLTFSEIIVIVLVFIAIQLYEIKQKMR